MPTSRPALCLAILSLLALLVIGAERAAGASRDVAPPASDAAAALTPLITYASTSIEALDAGPAASAAPAPVVAPSVASIPAVPEAAPVVVSPIARAPAPVVAATCPADWFCYPRLGLSGPIVPYADCGGKTDVGTSIRAFTCLSSLYLMGHAYTKFGAIVAWRSGDVVTAYGATYTITGAVIARSCDAPPRLLAPLSLQTSLTPHACGDVLIVQGH